MLLIDNQSSDPIQGFFEDGSTTNLFAEGESILGTGFLGTVNISYMGGTGNDVVLNLIAAPIPGDHNADGLVDAADYVVWQKLGSSSIQGYDDWRRNFGKTSGAGNGSGEVPEPSAALLILIAIPLLHFLCG